MPITRFLPVSPHVFHSHKLTDCSLSHILRLVFTSFCCLRCHLLILPWPCVRSLRLVSSTTSLGDSSYFACYLLIYDIHVLLTSMPSLPLMREDPVSRLVCHCSYPLFWPYLPTVGALFCPATHGQPSQGGTLNAYLWLKFTPYLITKDDGNIVCSLYRWFLPICSTVASAKSEWKMP